VTPCVAFSLVYKGLQVGWAKHHSTTDLVMNEPSFGDQIPNTPCSNAKALCRPFDIEKNLRIYRLIRRWLGRSNASDIGSKHTQLVNHEKQCVNQLALGGRVLRHPRIGYGYSDSLLKPRPKSSIGKGTSLLPIPYRGKSHANVLGKLALCELLIFANLSEGFSPATAWPYSTGLPFFIGIALGH